MNEAKLVALINIGRSFHFGTLWWIKDLIWKCVKPEFKVKAPDNKHPAICIGSKKITSLYQTLPMLLGSHSIHSGVWVEKLTPKAEEREKMGKGYFAIRPYNIGVFHTLGSDPGIEQNVFKPELSKEEKEELKKQLSYRGIVINE